VGYGVAIRVSDTHSYDRRVVSADELRAVMRRVPAGVAVVTVDLEGQRLGLTVASLVSLSLEPPLVGFAIRRDAALHELLREAQELAVSVLAAGQERFAQHFARGVPPIALWEGIPLRDVEGPPQLDGAVAWLRGRLADEHRTGDHTFFVASVNAAEAGPPEARPLLFHGQAYAAL
jgi:flavin reductase (DIM6/NTAB) family NADH-FMN oxidoreductase RutF